MIRVFTFTCDKYLWALRSFAHLFNRYWSGLQPVVIAGYAEPDFDLPDNFAFVSMGRDRGKDDWTTGVIEFLESVPDDYFVLMLEDYWLCRGVNHQAVETLHELATLHPQVLRVDLTDDRQYNGQATGFDYVRYYGYNDILWTPPESAYQMSLQAGIWNRRHMLEILVPGKSAWDVEIGDISRRCAARSDLWVLGTRQRPVRYANAFQGGNGSREAVNLEGLTAEDVSELREKGLV